MLQPGIEVLTTFKRGTFDAMKNQSNDDFAAVDGSETSSLTYQIILESNFMKQWDSERKVFKMITAFIDTRTNNEDFAITPYIGGYVFNKCFGLSITWGYYSFGFAIGKFRKGVPFFHAFTLKKKAD